MADEEGDLSMLDEITASVDEALESLEEQRLSTLLVGEYDNNNANSFNKKVNYIVQSIEYGILDKVHDKVLNKVENNPTFTIDDYTKDRLFDDYVINAFNEVMDEEYGSPEKKASDELPLPEEEPLSKEDLLNLEDFEDIYNED